MTVNPGSSTPKKILKKNEPVANVNREENSPFPRAPNTNTEAAAGSIARVVVVGFIDSNNIFVIRRRRRPFGHPGPGSVIVDFRVCQLMPNFGSFFFFWCVLDL